MNIINAWDVTAREKYTARVGCAVAKLKFMGCL
jgi:hypothetical protein